MFFLNISLIGLMFEMLWKWCGSVVEVLWKWCGNGDPFIDI
jgi:hypothetical protein